MYEAFQVSVFPFRSLKSYSYASRWSRAKTCPQSKHRTCLEVVASVTMSRRSVLKLALLTGAFWQFSVWKDAALADGAVSFATKITSRRRYGPRILGLEHDITCLEDYIHNQERDKIQELVSERYLNAQNKPRTGKFWSERTAFKLFGSGVFRDNKEILQKLDNEEQQFFAAATRLSKAASNNDWEEANKAYTDLKNAYYEFLYSGNLKMEDSTNV
ncbi:hypothetical protein GAYE_SCF39G5339 [Galdieria yellowstonensis]|uniref:Uncharacterized protein n=1 Tax=Galdieria yellowstonensis TaxID=3028027 RepID=A0AAV9IJ93_9RHOD|nr:hypothetical protein GAYE_SCF39G5339 [Galdieria yellowstonensis]